MKVAIASAAPINPDELSRLAGAARILGGEEACALWLLGGAEEEKPLPCGRVVHLTLAGPDPHCAEGWLPALTALYREEPPQILLFAGDAWGNELAARLSCRVDAACATGVCGMESGENGLQYSRMVYNANLKARFALGHSPAILALSLPDFPPETEQYTPVWERRVYPIDPADQAWCTNVRVHPLEERFGISQAKRIVVCGQGMGSRENLGAARELCGAIGGALAGTRPAAIGGWVPPERLIGISGQTVAPELAIILGASGSQAFTAGIRGNGMLVGVNSDENAPLFELCDVAVVADCVVFAAELAAIIRAEGESGHANG